jgi:hypothetical protein
VKRIEVDPSDVRVVGPGGAQAPRRREARFGLRLKIAGVIAFAEFVLIAFGGVNRLLLTAVAVALVAFHVFVGRNLPTLLRHVSWTLALSQAFVALLIAAIGISLFVVGILLVLALIIGVMMLLGERR